MDAPAERPWLLRLAESRTNYWATYAVNLSLLAFFLWWDATRTRVSATGILALIAAGVFVWTFSEYAFHRWMYHMGFPITVSGHQKHHDEPTAYIALPWMVAPLLFLPIHQVFANFLHLRGFSAFLAGWFGGYILYGFTHHSLHHYKLPFAWYRHMQSEHRIHHALPDSNYGVTTRLWDKVFRTEFRKPVR